MNHVLRYAEEKQCCIGAFDTPNLEILMAVIRAAEKREEPVIIQHAQLHECEMPIHIIGPIMVRMAKESRVPVCVMLDHGEDLDLSLIHISILWRNYFPDLIRLSCCALPRFIILGDAMSWVRISWLRLWPPPCWIPSAWGGSSAP